MSYEERIANLRSLFLDDNKFPEKKHTFLIQSRFAGNVNKKKLGKFLESVDQRGHKVDFNLIILIRFLFFDREDLSIDQDLIDQALSHFPFWPSIHTTSSNIFWSENHIFMYLTSAVLFRQRALERNLSSLCGEREELLLISYLEGHASFEGVYEVLSHTYLPYTFSALLNLYDFSNHSHLRSLASVLLERICSQILLCTNRNGVGTLTASGRQYFSTRTKNWGHNINQFIYLVTGHGSDDWKPSPLTDFLLTSTWTPPDQSLRFFNLTGFYQSRMNHRTEDIRRLYTDLDPIERVPFYWCEFFLIPL
jgi:hypothetical protein